MSATAIVKLPDGYTLKGEITIYECLANGMRRIKFKNGPDCMVHKTNIAILDYEEENKNDSK